MKKKTRNPICSDDIEIIPVNSKHNELLNRFETDVDELKSFLTEDALKNQQQKISLTFLWFYSQGMKQMSKHHPKPNCLDLYGKARYSIY